MQSTYMLIIYDDGEQSPPDDCHKNLARFRCFSVFISIAAVIVNDVDVDVNVYAYVVVCYC